MPSHPRGLRRHWPTRCHSHSGLGVTMWHPNHMSIRADLGVLLQHAWIWLFSTSFDHSRLRYAYCCHTVDCSRCASCPEGSISWLSRLWASKNYVQGWAHICFLWVPFWVGWSPVHLLFGLLGHICFMLRTYVMILCNWLILWQNTLYFKKPCFKIKYWSLQVCSIKQVQSAKSLKLDSYIYRA